jgi:probable F420-dependent oxidoreductase
VKIDAGVPSTSLDRIPALAKAAEAIGFDALWTSETQHDPFLPLALLSEHTQRVRFGTAIAVAFARSPGALAYTAWDLAQASQGRFILGLGTQVRAHIERRFGLAWPASPVIKLREFIQALKALWHTWQTGEPLNVRGEYFKLGLMTPFFNPGPIDHPHIPVYIAGVNPGLARLAGEVADGFIAHPYHSPGYLREVVQPAIDAGATRTGRAPEQVELTVSVLTATSRQQADFIRTQLAFYASTPTYRPVMAHHGWGDVADRLRALSRRQAWAEMAEQISDEMLETYAVVATPADLPGALLERYRGLAGRLSLYQPYVPGERDEDWRHLVVAMERAG